MRRIDAHQHFWIYNQIEHNWMTDEMYLIKKNFLPVDLKPLLELNNIEGTVLVQVTQSEQETLSLLKIAETDDFVKGVVGWVDLSDNNIRRKLEFYKKYPILKGFRHVLQTEEPGFMLQPDFMNGISALKEFDFTYDILIYPNHLEAAVAFVKKLPEQRFVVDHLAKPNIKDKKIAEWETGIRILAAYPNVCCKISGMVTEADWKNWREDDFTTYIDVILDAFGINRVMFGSDWPMCLVAASYEDVLRIVTDYFSSFSAYEQKLFFGENAINFYQLQ
jgi:Predicted metal-dependent hydrolase of the TIM-barrel fold